ncbi:TVP38/TMEM64 family protein [Desulfocurvus vexinensis]|uniref:TVP38/TMEM64 family protein n=1 Tax=Desulfocurvus vexinensis TaxID=399548 RepID=UPI0004B37279|nr:VTT domain-containing protein [Desulfocurvus vexinensis]
MDRQTRIFLKGLVLIASLVAAGLAARHLGLADALNEGWMDAHIRGQGLLGWLTFLALAALATGAGLPRQVVGFLAGYVYGFLAGTLLGVAGTLLGAALSFFYARLLGRGLVARRLARRAAGRVARADAFLSQAPFSTALIIRLMPVGSNILTNLLAGVSSVAALPFLLGSALGFVPQTAIFALLGSGFKVDLAWRVSLSAVLFALSSWLGWRIYRARRRAAALVDEDDAPDTDPSADPNPAPRQ